MSDFGKEPVSGKESAGVDFSAYSRIIVIGSPGSGKSTLTYALGESLGYPLLHLDYVYWRPGWDPMPREEFIALQRQWIEKARWIIDGNYNRTMELRFAAADLVIFLDLPRLVCLRRVLFRHGKPRPDMRPDVKESRMLSMDFLRFCVFIWRFPRRGRKKVLALHAKYPGAAFWRIRRAEELRSILKGLGADD